jgi:FHA domain
VSGVCPEGHPSAADDYCDVCGAPMPTGAFPGATAAPATAAGSSIADRASVAGPAGGASHPAGPTGAGGRSGTHSAAGSPDAGAHRLCPHCQAGNLPDALFCESCGYDFTTGALPRSAAPAPAPAAPPDPATPIAPAVPVEWVAEMWVDPDWYAQQLDPTEPCPSPAAPRVVPLTARSLLVGRVSVSRGIHPQLDAGDDSAVSRRQAQLSTGGSRWFVEDLDSSNGTFVGPATAPLPGTALVPGQRRELGPDDRIYVGAWTRIVVRRATEGERAGA